MGKIIERLRVLGTEGRELELEALLDSGASWSLVREEHAETLRATRETLHSTRRFRMANGEIGLESTQHCMLQIHMKGKTLDGRFYVVDRLPRDMIIGIDFLQGWEIRLLPKEHDYEIGVDPEAIELMVAV